MIIYILSTQLEKGSFFKVTILYNAFFPFACAYVTAIEKSTHTTAELITVQPLRKGLHSAKLGKSFRRKGKGDMAHLRQGDVRIKERRMYCTYYIGT